jgi:hypothetical protein
MPLIPPAGVYYDGDYTQALPSSGVETKTPFPNQPNTLIFSQKFQIHRDYFVPLDLNASPSAGGMTPAASFSNIGKTGFGPYLVEETERQDVGGGIVEWTRVWAHVPKVIYEFPGMNYQRQKYGVQTVPWSGQYDNYGNFHGIYRTFTALEEWNEPLTAVVERKFVCIPTKKYKPDAIRKLCKPLVPYRIIKFNDERGKEHVFELGTQGVAEPTQITQWMGDIFEVRNVYVQPATMGKELAAAGFVSNLPAWPYLNDQWQPVYL